MGQSLFLFRLEGRAMQRNYLKGSVPKLFPEASTSFPKHFFLYSAFFEGGGCGWVEPGESMWEEAASGALHRPCHLSGTPFLLVSLRTNCSHSKKHFRPLGKLPVTHRRSGLPPCPRLVPASTVFSGNICFICPRPEDRMPLGELSRCMWSWRWTLRPHTD